MKKIAFAVAACLALAGFGAADDAAVANRKWVRLGVGMDRGGIAGKD